MGDRYYNMELSEKLITCAVSQIEASAVSEFRKEWISLQENSQQSCFINWEWISAWLESNFRASERLVIIQATKKGLTVGLAIFSIRTQTTIVGKKLKQLWLHRNGSDLYDQIWIEHNDFLTASSDALTIRKLMFKALLSKQHWWDEIYIGLSKGDIAESLRQEHTFMRELIDSPSFSADISNCNNLSEYLQTLSKNTRSQLNRSLKGLEALGEIELTIAQTEAEKRDYLTEISTLHKSKWGDTLYGSGFSNTLFVKFHENILFKDHANQYSRLYRLSQDNNNLGYVYLLMKDDTWYFYLSAIEFHPDPKIKIGLLLHSMIIEQAIAANIKTYDFLAGESQYKKSLSNIPASEQKLVCFYRPTMFMLIREKLRNLKGRYHHFQGSK